MTTSPVMHWLAHGVPLTLLCDLVTTRDPESHALYLDEASPSALSDAAVVIATTASDNSVAIAG